MAGLSQGSGWFQGGDEDGAGRKEGKKAETVSERRKKNVLRGQFS